MKKILFTFMLLLCATAAWAGTGDGSKEKPYTGEWWVTDLLGELEEGDHLAYDCKILTPTNLSVTDERLNITVVTNCNAWSVGEDLIGDTPDDAYTAYCSFNAERENQTFIVTDYNFKGTRHTINGYYSGSYTRYEAEGYINVTTADELKSVIQANNAAKVHLGADIDISDIGKICDTFRGAITGEYDKVTPGTPGTQKAAHRLMGKNTFENKYSYPSSYLFDNVEGATFENIVFSNFRVVANDDNLGIIAKIANNSHFKNLIFVSNSLFNNDDYVGTVAGTASTCTFENVRMQSCDITTDALYAGGIVGKSDHCKFQNVLCGTTVYVFADGGASNAYSGGITGYSEKDNFTECVHMGMVGANSNYVGGMTGYSDESNFMSCCNSAIVATCEESKFGEMQTTREQLLLESLDEATIQNRLADILTAGDPFIVEKWFRSVYSFLGFRPDEIDTIEYNILCDVIMPFGVILTLAFPIIIPIALVIATAVYLYYEAVGDDYAGGIAGLAQKGTIEQCSNYGYVYAVDKFVGGIVGDASNVVINNCLNLGQVKQDRDNHWIDGPYRVGGIIGRGRDNTKINNCLTTNRYPVCGARTPSESSRLDQTSGNNYSFGRSDYDSEIDFLEKEVSQELLESGLVSLWLNNGVENREKGIMPWHQNLWTRPGKDGEEIKPDSYPLLDAVHNEVNADIFYDNRYPDTDRVYKISDESGLQAFADAVNSGTSSNGKQFIIGYLENDIDMTNLPWTPIGKDEDFKNFRGIFNGRGHKITGLTCSSSKAVGLIGTAYANAVICNVTVGDGSSFTCDGEAGAGGIVGKINIYDRKWGTVVIENCGSHANINGDKHAGGILGRIEASANENIKVYVNNCYSTGTVTARYGNSALLCGYTQHSGVVSNSWSSGQLRNGEDKSIWPYSIENDKHEAECLVGYSNNTINIKDCYIVNPDGRVDQYYKYKDQYPLQAGVEIIRETDLERGNFAYQLNGETNDVSKSLIWQQELGKDFNPTLGNKGLYHTREIQKDKYGTVCLPYQLKSDEDVAYYTFVGDETENGTLKLNFEYAETVPAAVPAIFLAREDNDKYYFPGTGDEFIYENVTPKTESQTPGSAWSFRGYFSELVINNAEQAQYVYYLSDNAIRNAKKLTIPPYRAFFFGPSIEDLKQSLGSQATARVSIVLDGIEDATTALELINDDLVPVQQSTKAYTLFGTEASKGYRGIVVREGKKVLM